MTTSYLTTTSNPHIAALESVFAEATKPIEWLVIAHNDAQMLRSLSSALAGKSAAILELSQDTWDFEDEDLPDTIEWALQQGHLTNLLLAGSSLAGGPMSRASQFASEPISGRGSSYVKLLAGVQRSNTRNRAAQARFAEHIQRMSQIPVVHNRWSSGELAVYGLFYRAESGLFLAYDADADTFRPLLAQR